MAAARSKRASKAEDSSSESTPPPIPDVVGERFDIKGKIGSGSYSEVHLGIDRDSGASVAAKFEWIYADKTGKLMPEVQLYQCLAKKGGYGAPEIFWSGVVGEYNVMVMEILGPSIEDLLRSCGKKLSLKTVSRLGEQMVDRLEFVHSCDILHRDIKPNNFLMGLGEHQDSVYIMDFGLAKKYRDSDGEHIPEIQKKGLTGTVRYTSHNVHKGVEPSRRDDLGSVGYVLIYLLLGRLPWQGINAPSKRTKQRKIGRRKEQTSLEELCRGIPKEFADYLEYCDNLGFDEDPDYDKLRRLLKNAGLQAKDTEDEQFDWKRLGVFNGIAAAAATEAKPEEVKPQEARGSGEGKRSAEAAKLEYPLDTKRRKKEEEEEEDVDDGRTFIWNVPAEKIRAAAKGERLESKLFALDGSSGLLRLRYWPMGHKKAAPSSCSAYVWTDTAQTVKMKIYVNKKAKYLDKDGPVHWKASNDRGYADFCSIPEGDVQLKLILLQAASQQPDIATDDYESYESESSSVSQQEDSEEEATEEETSYFDSVEEEEEPDPDDFAAE